MFKHPGPPTTQQRDLGNGLIARWSTPEDIEQIAQLQAHVFRGNPEEETNPSLMDTIRMYMSGTYPLMNTNDFAVVEDTHRTQNEQRIVAAACLMREPWDYAGIPFTLGRPEMVVSHPDYRNRGMIKAIFDLLHSRSEAEGHLVQGITGIPYFYRQFGYEYALELHYLCTVPIELLPPLPGNAEEPYLVRPANLDDLAFLQETYTQQRTNKLVSIPLDRSWWEFQIQTHAQATGAGHHWNVQIFTDRSGTALGYMALTDLRGSNLFCMNMGFKAGLNLQALLPSLLRNLKTLGEQTPPRNQKYARLKGIAISLHREHPLYQVLGTSYGANYSRPYAWYLRIHDLPRFLQKIKTVLEQRLAESALAGYSGELKLDFYRGGLRMLFEQGKITTIEDWRRPTAWEENDESGFPPRVFWQLLFGYRSLDELKNAYPDVWTKDEYVLLLNTLFPKQNSWAFPLG